MELDVIDEALDRLGGWDAAALADPELLVGLERVAARLEAVVARAAGAFDSSGNWAPDGAQTAPAWITAKCRVPRAEARRQVRRGRELHLLAETASAWGRGEITGAQVDVMVSLRTPETGAALARDEAMLVDQARTLTFAQFNRAAAYWRQLADPDGADRDGQRQRDRRDVYLAQSFQGTWFGAMTLDPISGAVVSAELERLEHELFEADWAEAKASLGRDPRTTELARTPGQRRADALVEMAVRSKSCPAGARRPGPLFTVLVGWETLHGRMCELEDGTVVPPGSVLSWLEEADLERAVFGPGRKVEMGAATRLVPGPGRPATASDLERAVFGPPRRPEINPHTRFFTGATRRAVEVRDRRCTHPFCDRPAQSSQVDHIQPWSEGGLTTQENGRLLCSFHNRLRNQRPPPAA